MNPYNTNPYREGEGTFRTHKLKDQKVIPRVGYHLNTDTYELEEIEQNKNDDDDYQNKNMDY